MADQLENLQLTISAQDAGASSLLDSIRAKIVAIEAELGGMGGSATAGAATLARGAQTASGALSGMASSGHAGAEGIKAVGIAADNSKPVLEEAASRTATLAKGFEAAGISGAAAASRIEGLAGAFEVFKQAAPEILAITAALTGAVAAAETFKDAIAESEALQTSMSQLGSAVTAQGGNWEQLSASVKDFADTQERLTTFSNLAVIKSMNQLVDTGMSVSDSMTVVRVAEDAAAATGRSLQEVTQGLMEAEHGRTQILASLGLATRAQIKDGMTFDEVLAAIEAHMGGAASEATKTYQGSLDALGSSWEHLMQDIGTPFLSVLSSVVQGLTRVVETIDSDATPALNQLATWFNSHRTDIANFFQGFEDAVKVVSSAMYSQVIPAIKDLWSAFGNLGQALNDVAGALDDGKSGWQAVDDALRTTTQDVGYLLDDLAQLIKVFGETSDSADSAWSSADEAARPFLATLGAIESAIAEVIAGLNLLAFNEAGAKEWEARAHAAALAAEGKTPPPSGFVGPPAPPDIGAASAGGWGPPIAKTKTDFNPTLGGQQGGGTGFTPPVLQDAIDKTQLETAAEKENEAVTNALADAKDKMAGIEATLAAAVKAATTVQGEQSAEAAAATQRIIDLAAQHNILNDALYTEGRMLTSDTAAQTAARAQYVAAAAAVDSWAHAHAGAKNISESEKETYERLKAALEQAQAKYQDAQHAVKSLTDEMRSHREEMARDAAEQITLASSARDAAASAAREWDKFYQDEAQKSKDDLATFQLTNAQKVAYFGNALAQQQSLATQNEALLERLYEQELQAFKDGQFQKVAALQQSMAQISADLQREYDLMKQYDQDELSSYKDMLQQKLDAEKAALQQEQSTMATVLDDLLTKQKTFAQEIKSISEDLFKNYLKTIADQMVEQPAFQKIAQFFGAPNVQGAINEQQSQQNAAYAATTLDLKSFGTQLTTTSTQQLPQLDSAFGNVTAAAQQAAAALERLGQSGAPGGLGGVGTVMTPSGPAIPTYQAGIDAQEYSSDFSAVSGDVVSSYSPIAPGSSVQIGWNSQSQASIAQSLQPWGVGVNPWGVGTDGTVQAGAQTAVSSMMSKVGSYISEALMGYMIGQSVNSMMYPNDMPGDSSSTWAGVGGAIGDVGGSIVGGPVGGMIGAVLGSLIGGLFGSHETAAQEPDVTEPTYGTQWNYGQFVSNMIGTYGTYNGQYYAAQAPYNQAEGGTPMGKQVFEDLQSLPKNLSPATEGLADQLRALENGDTNANALEIKSEYQGMFTLESGAQVSVQQYMQEIAQFMKETAGMIPTYTVSRSYPDYNQSTLTRTGEYDPTVSYGGTGAQGVPPPPPVQTQPGYPGSNAESQRPIELHVHIEGTVIGGGKVPDQVAQEIAEALQRREVGIAAGGLSRRMGTSVSGGDVF